jgi:hypothetical protein
MGGDAPKRSAHEHVSAEADERRGGAHSNRKVTPAETHARTRARTRAPARTCTHAHAQVKPTEGIVRCAERGTYVLSWENTSKLSKPALR